MENSIDIANYSGVAATDWSWGLVLLMPIMMGSTIYTYAMASTDLESGFSGLFSNEVYQSMQQNGQREDIVLGIVDRIPRTPLKNKVYRTWAI
jgi:hypothetical protein